MTGQGLGIAHVYHPLEKAKCVETLSPALISALHAKGQQRTKVVAQVAVRHGIERVVREADVVDPLDHRMSAQKLRHLAGVLYMPLHTKRHGLNPLQKQKAVKRRKCGSGVALANGSTARDERRIAVMIDVHHSVIGDL